MHSYVYMYVCICAGVNVGAGVCRYVYANRCMCVCMYVCMYVCMDACVLTISAPGQSVPRRMLGAARTQDSESWWLIFLLIMPVELDIRVCTLPPFGKWWTSTMHTSP